MSAIILPDGSLVFRLVGRTIHVDSGEGAIHVRDGRSSDELGEIMASVPMSAASVIHLLPEDESETHLYLEFETGDVLDLGKMPAGQVARHLAQALARVAGCRVSTTLEHTRTIVRDPEILEITALPQTAFDRPSGVGSGFSEPTAFASPFEGEKTEIPEDDGPWAPLPTVSAVSVDDEAPTKPPDDELIDSNDPTQRIDLTFDLLPRAASAG